MEDDNTRKQAWWKPGIAIFLRISGWIAGPVIIALYVGKYLDTRFGTAPFAFIGLMSLAFIGSMIAIVNISKKYISKIEKETKETNGNRIN